MFGGLEFRRYMESRLLEIFLASNILNIADLSFYLSMVPPLIYSCSFVSYFFGVITTESTIGFRSILKSETRMGHFGCRIARVFGLKLFD